MNKNNEIDEILSNESKNKKNFIYLRLNDEEKIRLERLAHSFGVKPNHLAYLCVKKVLRPPKANDEFSFSLDLAQPLIKSIAMSMLEEIRNLVLDEKEDKYWNIGQLCEYLGASPSTLHRNLLHDPRFPKPVVLNKTKTKRWLASECKKALLLFRT